jgi:hypothetical protein
LLAGFNSGEIRSLRALAPRPPANAAEYERMIRERYLDLADEFLKLYPSTNLEESILATTRDALYGWTAERLVRKQAALGAPSFLYYFDTAIRPPIRQVCTRSMPASYRSCSGRLRPHRRIGRRSRRPARDEVE